MQVCGLLPRVSFASIGLGSVPKSFLKGGTGQSQPQKKRPNNTITAAKTARQIKTFKVGDLDAKALSSAPIGQI